MNETFWIVFLALYWAFGTWFMTWVAIPQVKGKAPTLLDLFGCATLFWLIGPILVAADLLDRVKIGRDLR